MKKSWQSARTGIGVKSCCPSLTEIRFMVESLVAESMSDSFACAEFGDRRLSKRLVTIVERLSEKPNMSIPGAMHGRAEMEGAYRFFDNPKVSPNAIMAPHIAATLERIRGTEVVLLVQDTTEVDVTRPEQQVDGVGPIECESRVGAFYHPLCAFDGDGLPLGTVWSKTWVRETIETELPAAKKEKKRRVTPIEDKESIRWLEGIRAARDVANACPQTQCVCLADSEGDIYELFAEPREAGEVNELHLLVRGCHDRALNGREDHLLDAVRASPCLYECSIDVSGRESKIEIDTRARRASRDARIATVEVRSTTVTLRPPYRPDRTLPEVSVNVVLVEERNPPLGQIPIQWILITTLPIDTAEQVKLIAHYYAIRWQIEIYFKTLKSGCRVESRYFERLGRLLNCFAVYTVVAWKVFYLCRLSRQCPDLNCEVVFEPCEWKPVYMAVRRQEPPLMPPSLNEMTRMIASLGGYVIRRSTQPGTQTLWLGLQRLYDLSSAWIAFGPETRPS